MNPTNDLDRLDRTTLRAWRVSNLLAWGAVAAFAGIVGNWIAMNSASATANFVGATRFARPVTAVLFAAVVGALLGGMVGAHVYRSPGVVAGVAAGLAGFFFPETGALIEPQVVGMIVTFLAEIAAAVLVARLVWRRRPAALRAP